MQVSKAVSRILETVCFTGNNRDNVSLNILNIQYNNGSQYVDKVNIQRVLQMYL